MEWWSNYYIYPQQMPLNYQPNQSNLPQNHQLYHLCPPPYNPNLQTIPYFYGQTESPQIKKEQNAQIDQKEGKIQQETPRKNIQRNPVPQNQKCPNSTRNIKANILKDFNKSIKKDATQILIAKKTLNSNYQIKKFLQQLSQKLPGDGKYIRAKTIRQMVNCTDDIEFSKILRVVLRNFLKGDYINFILIKKKNTSQYLKASRQLYKIVFKKSQLQQN